jgi:hypothetical protein
MDDPTYRWSRAAGLSLNAQLVGGSAHAPWHTEERTGLSTLNNDASSTALQSALNLLHVKRTGNREKAHETGKALCGHLLRGPDP